MKKYLNLSIVFMCMVLFVVGSSSVNAENVTNGQTKQDRETIRQTMMRKIQETRSANQAKLKLLRDEIKGEKDSAKAKIKELRLSLRQKALFKFAMVTEKIGGLKTKVNRAIQKLQVKGVDVSKALELVNNAEDKVNEAQDKAAQINSILVTSINELSDADKAKIKTLAKDTQTLLKDAHQELKDAVKSLKDEIKKKEDTHSEDKTKPE